MKIFYSICLSLLLALLASCGYSNSNRNAQSDRSRPADSTATNSSPHTPAELEGIGLNYRGVVAVDSSDYVIIPVGAMDKSSSWNKRGRSLNFYGGDGKYNDHHLNMIFYHLKKDSAHLLLPKEQGVILNYTIPQNEYKMVKVSNEYGEYNSDYEDENEDMFVQQKQLTRGWHASQFIFYNIRSRDYNFDGVLDYKDSNHLYASRKDGSDLMRLTPANTQLQSWEILRQSNMLLARVLVDSDDDKVFSQKNGDDIRLIRIDLRNLKKGRPLLSDEQEQMLKTQFYELYIKKAEE